MQQATLLREGQLSRADIENIAEEIESMGKSERRELVNRLTVLLTHLLKWLYQPSRRGKAPPKVNRFDGTTLTHRHGPAWPGHDEKATVSRFD